eukprot:CAMPEP_0185029222 /NCGR_PEP_ID=MMETSP1103-20130426/15385_1 /TAXON_ID=36769 /ORGANISM="Paraphysomonas bandaiensis, Strain Caron Lab Isolate" /LENGTH=511 /DNA_ID=CAMNT_0027563885 /DNA_START=164 /DNA_END=1699 /DNA_ORIENTATION=-
MYDVIEVLGEGAFSIVQLATSKLTGQKVAVKCISKFDIPESEKENLNSEIEISNSLDHPYIVRYLDAFEDDDFLYVVLEYLPGGELFDRIVAKTSYSEDNARDCVRVICTGLNYIHSNGIVHRDIKPENLLLTSCNNDSDLKIGDFGLAARVSGATLVNPCGTPGYAAPEIVSGQPYGIEVDMWALGVVAYCLIGGYPPFAPEDDGDLGSLFASIRSGVFSFDEEYWGEVSNEAKNFICRLLCVDVSRRMSAEDALKHPWLMLDSSHLVGRNLTANLEMLRRYQAGLKFKATATVLIAAKRFKKKLSKAKKRRAHRPAPIEEGIEAAAAGTQNDKVHKLGPTLSSSKLLTPVLTQNRQDMKKQKSRPRRDKGFDRKNSTEKSAQLTVSGRSKGPRSRICEYDDNGRQVGAEKNGSEIDILTGTQLLPVERKHVSRSDSWQRSHRASGEICTSSSNSPYIGHKKATGTNSMGGKEKISTRNRAPIYRKKSVGIILPKISGHTVSPDKKKQKY